MTPLPARGNIVTLNIEHGINYFACRSSFCVRSYDRTIAMNRLLQSGVILSTTESIIFDMLGTAAHPSFKQISSMIVAESRNFENEFAQDRSL